MTTPIRTTDRIVRENVANLMRLFGHTQAQLAETMRLSQPSVSRKLEASGHITLHNLDLIARHFGLTVPQLVTPDLATSAERLAVYLRHNDGMRRLGWTEAEDVG